MPLLLVIHCAVTWVLVGLIWTVQIVLYPLFPLVRMAPDAFASYHWRHMLGITFLVMPLVIAEALTAAWLIWAGEQSGWLLWSLIPLLGNVLSTALVQAPLHLRLSHDLDGRLCRRLISTNWIRTACWTLRGVMVAVLLYHELLKMGGTSALVAALVKAWD